ncbi:hypothetical protein G6M89_20540 [Natronolimnobius sp. AArcel1]|uniref:hypothetical protein n=1 Tax=Natronolimnobius sp. AArcel1 TaxID=1679093 RepID=UPI0013EBF9A8|nr:hypothetical protein [Natronolimnobius sp. AArcel1]NGM71356.1 hypothetical protein [Natronolimnobius sp. AArcel1]
MATLEAYPGQRIRTGLLLSLAFDIDPEKSLIRNTSNQYLFSLYMENEKDKRENTDSEGDSKVADLSLREYVSDNSNLFVVMGVFAALSVYVSSIPSEGVNDDLVQLGLVASLLITGLLSFTIISAVRKQVPVDFETVPSLLHPINYPTLLFLTLFLTLLFSILQIVSQDTEVLAIIAVLTFFSCTFGLIVSIGNMSSNQLAPYIRHSGLRSTVSALVTFGISHHLMVRTNDYLVDEYNLYHFQFDNSVTFAESVPLIVYTSFSFLTEITPIIAIMMGFISVLFAIDVAGVKYARLKDLLRDH